MRIATAVVSEIVARGEVTVTVSTSDNGLQRAGGTPTTAPATAVQLSTKGTIA